MRQKRPDRTGGYEDVGIHEEKDVSIRDGREPVHARGEADVRVMPLNQCTAVLGDLRRVVERVIVERENLAFRWKLAAKSGHALGERGVVVPGHDECRYGLPPAAF
jgi:hypothetical protein